MPYYKGPLSDHFNGKRFYDPSRSYPWGFFRVLKWLLTRKKPKWPKRIPQKMTKPEMRVLGKTLKVTCVGHVTFLIQTQGLNILTDPVWSERASPFSFWGPERILSPGVVLNDLPPIDVVFISHNHYDHLDMTTLSALWEKHRPRIITPLGNDKIIHSYQSDISVEVYDWGDKVVLTPEVTLHLSPMQHWSARGVFDRNKALWAAMTLETSSGNIYFVGDSGYGKGQYFKQDRKKFGKFRLALLPMGAYSPKWFMEYAHMSPQEMVQAYEDLGEPYTIPSHYDVFPLADENYGQALQELSEALQKRGKKDNIFPMKVGECRIVPLD